MMDLIITFNDGHVIAYIAVVSLVGHETTILAVDFSPKRPTIIASGDLNGCVFVWDASVGAYSYFSSCDMCED